MSSAVANAHTPTPINCPNCGEKNVLPTRIVKDKQGNEFCGKSCRSSYLQDMREAQIEIINQQIDINCTRCNNNLVAYRALTGENHHRAGLVRGGGKRKRKPIKINPKMKGVFTRKAKRKGMSVQKYARYVIKKYKGKTKNKKQLKLLRQAVFAKTAKKWKKRGRKSKRRKK